MADAQALGAARLRLMRVNPAGRCSACAPRRGTGAGERA